MKVGFVFLLLLNSLTTFAQITGGKGVKVCLIDMQRVLLTTNEGKAIQQELKKFFEKKKESLDQKSKALEQKRQDLEKQAPLLNPQAAAKKSQQLQKEVAEIQAFYASAQKQMQEKKDSALKAFSQKIDEQYQQHKKKNNLDEKCDLTLDPSNGGFVSAKDLLDTTSGFIEYANKSYANSLKKK